MQEQKLHMQSGPVRISPLRLGMLYLFLVLIYPCVNAQTEGEYRISWIGQFPGNAGGHKAGFRDRVSRIVFGQKAQEVVKPFNVVAENPEQYWILDQGAGGIFKVEEGEGSLLRSKSKSGQEFSSLVGLCRTPEGDLLFTDSRLNQLGRIAGEQLLSFGDSLKLNQPTGIAFSGSTGQIWVVETGAHCLALLNEEGKLIRKIGRRGTGPGFFNFPTFIWIDESGRVYIVDSMNYRVQIFDREGAFLGAFGESGDATGYMARPKGVATDSRGHVYVSDALFHVVQIFDRQGNFLYSFGSQGQGEGEFWMPAGIFIDAQDHIYVADSYNARIQIFKLEKN